MTFAQSERGPGVSEGLFEGPGAKNRYILSSPVVVPAGRSIAVDVELIAGEAKGAAEAAPTIRTTLGASSEPDGDPSIVEATFPLLSRESRFFLRLKPGSRIASLYVKSAGEGAFRIKGISTPETMAGFEQRADSLSVSSGFRLAMSRGTREFLIESPFEGLSDQMGLPLDGGSGHSRVPGLVIGCGAASGAGGTSPGDSIAIDAYRQDGVKISMSLRISPKGLRTVIGSDLLPEDAAKIIARSPDGVSMQDFLIMRLDSADYELSDLGRVLAAGQPVEGMDYALYRWDALPSVLIFVFKDYDAQDRYLKRLAFFAEKAGYRGTLQRDQAIAPLHGWNAHDYRPEDLAAFFEKARAENFPLSAQERKLETLLRERGILTEEAKRIQPGKGAIISISLESSPALRRTLLVHESTHAIFFADEDYRELVRRTWGSISMDEKWFWKTYFAWAAYDTGSDYLMANEFQAYLLQQPVSAVEEYFTKRKPEELLAKHPELEPRIEEYMKTYGRSFEARARDLELWLSRKYGFTTGKTYHLEMSR